MSSLSDDELRAGILQLQERRAALASEARTRARTSKPREPRKPKEKKVDPVQAAMLALLQGKDG